jgi:hypothetical protein
MMDAFGTSVKRRVPVIPRQEFLREFKYNYSQGQHLSMIGPTQRGKTTLCLQLLKQVISPQLRCVILAGKPPGRDGTMAKAADMLNLRVIEEWPPEYSIKDRKRNGYVLRPHQTLKDLVKDEDNLKAQFRKAMLSNYASKKPVITVVDEAHHVQNDLGLKREYEAPLMRGAPIDAEWSLIQRGRFMSYLAYDAPEHLFLFFDPDRSNTKRYSEMGGIDPKEVEYLTLGLKTYRIQTGPKTETTISEALYIRRAGPEFAIVDVR